MSMFSNDPALRWLIRNPIWGFVLLIFVFFSLASDHFFDFRNFQNILVQTSTIGLIALGMTLVMINGNIDLSVGATLALAAAFAVDVQSWAAFATWGNWQILPAVCLALLVGILQWGAERLYRVENRGGCLHRHAGRDAGHSRAGFRLYGRAIVLRDEFRLFGFQLQFGRPISGSGASSLCCGDCSALLSRARCMGAIPMRWAATARPR
jgi:hypothetical protein